MKPVVVVVVVGVVAIGMEAVVVGGVEAVVGGRVLGFLLGPRGWITSGTGATTGDSGLLC